MKKAVILAGGKGTRLSPLTDNTPKPLMPYLGKTIIERILHKLKDAGIENVVISTMHMSGQIKEKLGETFDGITINYIVEKMPLGTAGSMKYAKKILNAKDEPILVISGDCICDFDLKKISAHHKNCNCDATIVTTECDDPLEYGVVLSGNDGCVSGFNEKPCWAQVNCSKINTGIYILNSAVIDMIPEKPYDFSKDLFPEMLKNNMRISEYCAEGFWCDIGSPESYYKCAVDALEGKLDLYDTKIENSVFLSDDVKIGENVLLGPNVSVEKGCEIRKNCKVSGSILHENVIIGEGSKVEGAIICKGAKIGSKCIIEGGAIIGSDIVISDKSVVKSGTCISLKKQSTSYSNSDLFISENGIELCGKELCDYFAKTLVATIGKGGRIGIMYEENEICKAYYSSVLQGLENGFCHTLDFGCGFSNLAKFSAVNYSVDCMVFVNEKDGRIFATLFNRNGLSPSHEFERRFKENFRKGTTNEKSSNTSAEKVSSLPLYYCALTDNLKAYPGCDLLDGQVICICTDKENSVSSLLKKSIKSLGGMLCDEKCAAEESRIKIIISEDDIKVSQSNYTIDSYHMLAALFEKEKVNTKSHFDLPFLSPGCFFEILNKNDIFRYPNNSSYRVKFPERSGAGTIWTRDNLLLTARFISYIVSEKINLSELNFKLPKFFYKEKEIKIPEGISKTFVIKNLACTNRETLTKDSYEGITISYPNGEVTVVPGKSRVFKLYSDAKSAEIADELLDITESKMLGK